VLILGISLVPSSAGTITLDQLLTRGASLQVGDKIFADWKWESGGSGPVYIPPPEEIVINYSQLPNGNVSLVYNCGVSAWDGGSGDLLWRYTVSTASGKPWIHDWSMALIDFGVQKMPGSHAFIIWQEALYDENHNLIINPPPAVSELKNIEYGVLTPPYSKIWVENDLTVYTEKQGDAAHVSQFEQRWSQVPEASSYALFGLGFVGLGLFRRFCKR